MYLGADKNRGETPVLSATPEGLHQPIYDATGMCRHVPLEYHLRMAAVSACAQFIREVMQRRHLKQLEVARRLGQSSNGFVRCVVMGSRALPLDALEDWVKALELSTEEARAFRRLAIRSYAPQYVQQLVDELDQAKAEVEGLRKIVAELEGDEPG